MSWEVCSSTAERPERLLSGNETDMVTITGRGSRLLSAISSSSSAYPGP